MPSRCLFGRSGSTSLIQKLELRASTLEGCSLFPFLHRVGEVFCHPLRAPRQSVGEWKEEGGEPEDSHISPFHTPYINNRTSSREQRDSRSPESQFSGLSGMDGPLALE